MKQSVSSSPASPAISVSAVQSVILAAAGLRVRDADLAAVQEWVIARVHALDLDGIDSYGHFLSGGSSTSRAERERLSVRLTTGETHFMRDAGQIDLLRREILPDLIARRSDTRRLRIWSAGCSTGEETYTLAILAEEFGSRLAGWQVDIVGTDINRESLDKAAAGRYGDWSFRAVDEELRRRHFRRAGKHWVVEDSLRRRVRFKQIDLLADAYPESDSQLDSCDLIVCRNVFIYMATEAVGQVTAKLARCLADGGYLMTGHNELLGYHEHGLHTRIFDQSVVLHRLVSHLPERMADAPSTATRPLPRPLGRKHPTPVRPVPLKVVDFKTVMERAWQLADAGLADEAEQACKTAQQLSPLDPWPYYLTAQLAQARGAWAEARRLLDRVIYLNPAMIAAYLDLSALHERGGNPDRSRLMLQTALKELSKLAPGTPVLPFENSTAADLRTFVERRLEDRFPSPAPSGESPGNRMVD